MKELLDLTTTDINEVQIETKYCVDQATHDLHCQKSIKAGYPPIPVAKPDELKEGPIAIVCSGPSLKDTWQDVKNFPVILTCSGAHDFLIERGIIPQFHMETDPRAHKAVFTRNPRKDITYLIASSCHPDVFENLKGCDVRIWHVTGNPLHKMPRGHWQITGGCNVGLRALVMARLMGYVDVHVFGMDCSGDKEQLFHANFHPNEPKKKGHRLVRVGDKEYFSSDVFIECARQFFKETMLLSDVRVTLHGEGLLQALAIQKMSDPKEIEKRREFIEKRGGTVIALSLPKTITQEYVELNKKLHEINHDYGGHGDRYAKIVRKLAETNGIKSILDYGCGKGALAEALDVPIWEYDPGIEGKEAAPRPADLVVCTDVLEHIEPELLPAVLEDLKRVIKVTGFFAIHTGAAGKTLPDGRNTHLIQQGMDWWRSTLEKYFTIAYCGEVKGTPMVYIIVAPKGAVVQKVA
jgi:uncharacterized Rossmann fold enzyme